MKPILLSAPAKRPSAVTRHLVALTLASLSLAIGCGDKPEDAPETATKTASQPSSEWTPVEVPETSPATTSPQTAQVNDARATENDMIAKAQAQAEGSKAELEKAQAAVQSPPVPSAPSGPPPEIQAIMKQGQALQAELEALTTKLRATHQKALKNETVAAKKKVLDDAAIKEISKISPGIEKEWKRLQTLITELENSEELTSNDPAKISEATRAKFSEMQTLSQKIEPLQMKVIDLPEIKKLRDEFADAVDAETKRLEPKADELTARFSELTGELQALQRKFMNMQQQGGLQSAPPTAPTPPTAPAPPTAPQAPAPQPK